MRAVAAAPETGGGASGLAVDSRGGPFLVGAEDDNDRFDDYLPAATADLLRRLGRHPEAVVAYQAAVDLTTNEAERRFLQARLAESAGG